MTRHAATAIGRAFLLALLFIVNSTYFSGVQAQTVYKCGNIYSQVPCPNAQAVQVDDRREPEQKQQTDTATLTDTKLAKALEKERLAREKSVAHATKPKRKASSIMYAKETRDDKKLTEITPMRLHNKTTKPEGFVAQVPASGPVVKK